MATAAAILKTAASQVGYCEEPPGTNRTKYWAELKPSYQGGAWCAAYVQWVLKKNGMWYNTSLPYYVPQIKATAKARGEYKLASPKPGDLVLFDFKGTGRPQHIGFVEKVFADGSLQTLEGNTSKGTTGSQNNGWYVARRHRSRLVVDGFVTMKYDKPVAPKPDAFPLSAGHWYGIDDGTRRSHSGARAADRPAIKKIQKKIGATQDGHFGPKTKAKMLAYEKARKWRQNGMVGSSNWNAMF